MARLKNVKGTCMCGTISFTAQELNSELHACHCKMCRSWSGGPFLAVECDLPIDFEGKENITEFDSSNWAKRGFCKRCGSHLYYKVKAKDKYYIPIGLFDDSEQFEFTGQIFIDRKPHYYEFKNKTSNMTEKEVFDLYG